MLSHARMKTSSIQWIKGAAEQIPLPDATFHGAIATLTIHHWQSLQNGFTEISRILNDKGRLVIFTATPEQMQGYWLNHYFPQMLKEAIAKMPSAKEMQSAALRAGFQIVKQEKYFIQPDLKDSFLYVEKHAPELYFRDAIRQGISSFASHQNKVEVEQGLCWLQHDINTKEFESVQKRFDNNMGDYLFICAQK
jgi:SAM-dependent methyltransferase